MILESTILGLDWFKGQGGNFSGKKTSEEFAKANFLELYERIMQYGANLANPARSYKEALYLYFTNSVIPVCEECKETPVKFKNLATPYVFKFCCSKCAALNTDTQTKLKATNLERYGTDSAMQSTSIKSKVKETMISRYGVDSPAKLADFSQKMKATNLAKYGVEHSAQLESTKNKRKTTVRQKYGVDHTLQVQEIRTKIEQTNLSKFGNTNAAASAEIRTKIEQTNQIKYGSSNPASNKTVRNKIENTNLHRYGFKNAMQSNSIKNKVKKIAHIKFQTAFESKFSDRYKLISKNGPFLKLQDLECMHEFEISLSAFSLRMTRYKTNGCTVCNPLGMQDSSFEQHIESLLINSRLVYERGARPDFMNGKELDFFVPSKNLAIECNGNYWHSEDYKDKHYHIDKTKLCTAKGIKLLQIFEDEFHEKLDIVESRLKNEFGSITNKVFARKCKVQKVSSKDAKEFLEKNHIQGSINSSHRYGLFYNNELIQIMTFGSLRKALGANNADSNEFELYRLCAKLNTSVIGGASKLLQTFIRDVNPSKIVTFADRRWSIGSIYEKLGFEFVNETGPNYWYMEPGSIKRLHRFNFRKNVLVEQNYDSSMSESQIMQARKYKKIWDCGNLKYEMTFNKL